MWGSTLTGLAATRGNTSSRVVSGYCLARFVLRQEMIVTGLISRVLLTLLPGQATSFQKAYIHTPYTQTTDTQTVHKHQPPNSTHALTTRCTADQGRGCKLISAWFSNGKGLCTYCTFCTYVPHTPYIMTLGTLPDI